MTNHSNRNFGLDFVRAIAIGLVVMAHFGHENFGILGFFGVELFFGLSGFLIGRILWRSFLESDKWGFNKIHNFWSRRWWRTLPNYYLFILLMLLFDLYSKDNLIPPLSELFKYLWFGQYLFSHQLSFYSVSWSLCVEEWFYLTFPISLLLLSKFKFSPKNTFIIAITVFYVLTLFIKLRLVNHGNIGDVREITLARLDAICSGVLITFWASTRTLTAKNKIYLFLAGIVLILSPLVFVWLHHTPIIEIFNNIIFLITVPLGFSMCLPFVSGFKTAGRLPSYLSQSITNLSLYSYSIYLSHIPVMFLTYSLMGSIRQNSSIGNLISKIVALSITILISSFIYRYFEVPLTAKRPRELKQQVKV